MIYRCGVEAPEVLEERALNFQSNVSGASPCLLLIKDHSVAHVGGWLSHWEAGLGRSFTSCAYLLMPYYRRLLFTPPSIRESHTANEREETVHFLREIMLLSAKATLWMTSRSTVSSRLKGKIPISLSGDQRWHIPRRFTGSTWYAFVIVENRACHGGELSSVGLQGHVIILFLSFACYDSHPVPVPVPLEVVILSPVQFLHLDTLPSSGFLSLAPTQRSRPWQGLCFLYFWNLW